MVDTPQIADVSQAAPPAQAIFDNPMGIDGFDFVEFASPQPAGLHELFSRLGFALVARHRSRPLFQYRQGDCSFLVNEDPDSFAADFARQHGPSACGFGLRVRKGADWVREQTLAKGAKPMGEKETSKAVPFPVIEGIGGCMLYLVDSYDSQSGGHFGPDWERLPNAADAPEGFGLRFIDHLTHNLYPGNMDSWAQYYQRLFNFREIRYFDVRGAKTGMLSRAMGAPDGRVRIPLNESGDPKSQINEYLEQYNGEGIQHIACLTEDIYTTIEAMRARGIDFLATPGTYYPIIEERIPRHGENLARMQANGILIDADHDGDNRLLLQIFTKNYVGPIFFEIIQRKGNLGFGEGNFQALFEAIEREQIERGHI